jgi:hypothetical protein
MATVTVTPGYNWVSGEVVTPAKMNLAAAPTATVSAIVDADVAAGAAIAGTKLASNSITNTQIKSDAAIAGTKIAPNFGSQNVVTTGSVSTGTTSPSAQLHITKASIADYNGAATDGQLGAGATALIQQTAGTNTGLAQLVFQPREGQPFNRIACSGGSSPFMAFATNNTERMRINSSGQLGIGTASPDYLLDVNGVLNTTATYRVNGTVVVGARQTGWGAPTGVANRATFDTATINLELLARRVKALIDDLRSHGLIGD